MASGEDFNIAIISDFHMSQGRDPKTRKFDLKEDFFFDEVFVRFLAHLRRESQREERKWRLILAGDMVDFLQITTLPPNQKFNLRKSEEKYGLGTAPDKTIWKMKVMMEGHPLFFSSLGTFISEGHLCTIVSGNHDIEWSLPEIQKAFREEMKNKYLPPGVPDPDRVVSEQIEFCPWFYYEAGLIWVEHGQQYDGINSFDFLLYPYLPNSDELLLPAGSFFVRYLFNQVEQKDPFADNIKPASEYFKKYWVRLLFSKKVVQQVKHFWKILLKVRKLESNELDYLNQRNEERIDAEAKRFGIAPEKLHKIKMLRVPSFLYNMGKLKNLIKSFTYNPGDNFKKAASVIQQELDVKWVVMGHTHEVALQLLRQDATAQYSNSGTWTKIFSNNPGERLLHEEQESVFIRIRKTAGGRLDLMKWRDEIDFAEEANLFDSRPP